MANDTTIRTRYPTGATLYTQIEAPDGTFWNGTSFAAFSVASWTTFATATPETPASSGRYVCQFPTSAPAGYYTWATYLQAGGAPAASDVCVASGSGYWDGTTFGGASKVTGSVGSLVAFGFSVTATSVTNPVQIDLTQSIPVRNQDAVTAPTLADAYLGAWTEPFAKETTDPSTGAYVKQKPDNSGPVRSYSLTVDINGNVTAR